jgi:predicted CXXCH cytochrome family protein
MSTSSRRIVSTTFFGLFLLTLSGGAVAYSTYSGCESCHGGFRDSNYVSAQDQTNWGTDLMSGHEPWVGNDCDACHNSDGYSTVQLNASASNTFPKSCVGCHGREQDVTGSCTGLADGSDGVEAECGSGAGLRQMHESQVGAGTCTSCHTSDGVPVGENVQPSNYSVAASSVKDACDADGTESKYGATGLDNDGNGQRDADDPNCQEAQQFVINPGLNDAWFNPSTAGQGLLLTVFEDAGLVFLAWFTYDVERPPEDATAILGEPGHRWLTAQGPYQGDTAVLDAYVSSGGVFNSAEPVVPAPTLEGTISIQWTGCNSATLSYDLLSAGQGVVPLQRIAPDNVPLCEALQEPNSPNSAQ